MRHKSMGTTTKNDEITSYRVWGEEGGGGNESPYALACGAGGYLYICAAA